MVKTEISQLDHALWVVVDITIISFKIDVS